MVERLQRLDQRLVLIALVALRLRRLRPFELEFGERVAPSAPR